MILDNTFREKLNRNEPTLSTHFLFTDPDIPEIIGDTGFFDYAEFSAEYSSFDMNLLYHLARSAQCGNLPLMIKLDQEGQGFWAQAALGAGFKSVLFTDVRTPEDVDSCHRSVRADMPGKNGMMGVKMRRPALSGYDIKGYAEDLEAVVVAIMIEKHVTVENIDAVLARARERGVDMTQWGPADYGFSRGQPGMMATPEIRPIEELVIKKSLEYGIHPRIEIGEPEQARRYIDMGVRHFCIGWDRFILRAALGRLGEGLRKLLDGL
jgi:2-keto-3-deoxy-L-rhamnonate aldolase RhmA